MLDEERLQYVGSMVLGMNDALVELTVISVSVAVLSFLVGIAAKHFLKIEI